MKKILVKIKKIPLREAIPFIAFIIIFLFFTFMSYSQKSHIFKMLTVQNFTQILEQTMQTILVASGTIFVVAMGSTDLSVGVTLALSGVLGAWIATATGMSFLMIPVSLVVGALVGLLNGVLLAKLKVSSFMITLAELIAIRGLVNFIQDKVKLHKLPKDLSFLSNSTVKIILFLVIVGVMAYLFEFTPIGRYARAIGDNEVMSQFVGIPVDKIKIICFVFSGLLAGAAGIFSVANIGSTSQQMGVFQEIRTVMAIFLGGVLVNGGSSAKFYKILLGSFSIQVIVTGLSIIGKGDSYISQTVQGLMLIAILLLCVWAGKRDKSIRKSDSDMESIVKGK